MINLKIKAVFKGKPVHRITLVVKVQGDTVDEAFGNFVHEASLAGIKWIIIDGYGFKHEDVLYYELVDHDDGTNDS